MSELRQPIDVAHAALLEAGRPDLAGMIVWFDEDGGYLEANDDVLSEEEWALVDKAETIARQSIGLPPIERVVA